MRKANDVSANALIPLLRSRPKAFTYLQSRSRPFESRCVEEYRIASTGKCTELAVAWLHPRDQPEIKALRAKCYPNAPLKGLKVSI